MTGKEFRRRHPTAAFALHGDDAQGILATCDDKAGAICPEDFTGRTVLFDDFRFP